MLRAHRQAAEAKRVEQFAHRALVQADPELARDPLLQVNAAPAHGAVALKVRPLLDPRGYAQLAKQSTRDRPRVYRNVQPGLFDAIVMQKLPPAPGPQAGRGGPSVSPGDQS